jgi:hypothetical protein
MVCIRGTFGGRRRVFPELPDILVNHHETHVVDKKRGRFERYMMIKPFDLMFLFRSGIPLEWFGDCFEDRGRNDYGLIGSS